MKDSEAVPIIQQALLDNGRDTFVGTDAEGYESSCSVDELVRQIVNRLRQRGVFQESHLEGGPF